MDVRRAGTHDGKTPAANRLHRNWRRALRWTFLSLGIALLSASAPGCAATSIRSQSPEDIAAAGAERTLVGELAVPDGLQPVAVEAVALVTGLAGTGSDPHPGPERAALLNDMQKRGVINPNQVLASSSTSLALVRGYMRAGIQAGDRFDLEIRVPSRSETSSLRDGWLMESQLREMAALGNQIHEGHPLARAQGPILVDPAAESSGNTISQTRGRVLGGGIAKKSRPLRLVLKPDHRSVRNSSQIGAMLNRRFFMYHQGIKQGVATPKTDEYVQIEVHPRYKDNIPRYMQVLRAVPLRETPSEQMERLKLLERQLLDPITADAAALRLEAVGKAAADTLAIGVKSEDPLVRFYAAEALAYLDDRRAVPALAQAAREEPAFRVYALSALGAMDDFSASQELREMLALPSAETRYGAFRALWAMDPHDPALASENLGDQFSYHALAVGGPPLIHLTRSFRAEVVLFGKEHRLKTPVVLDASQRILIKADTPDEVVISRFEAGSDVQKRTVSNSIDAVVRAIVELGGSYPDVVQALQQAKLKKCLSSRLEIDALPQPGREYTSHSPGGEPGRSGRQPVVSTPLPDLFATPKEEPAEKPATEDAASEPAAKSAQKGGFLARLRD